MPEVAAAQVLVLLRQGDPAAAARLAQAHELPLSRARVLLAQGDPSAALAALEPLRQQVEAKGRQDERLEVMVLQAVALRAHGDKDEAVRLLGEALALAEPGGLIRIFVDEGLPMARLLAEAAARGVMPGYIGKLLSAFEAEGQPVPAGRQASPGKSEDQTRCPAPDRAIEPTRAASATTRRPRTLEPRDWRAAFPRPGHGQRAQPQDLRQAASYQPHRSHSPRPRAGFAVASVMGEGTVVRFVAQCVS